jgi:hypothetical protein
LDRTPSDSEQQRLLSATEGQWSDGIGLPACHPGNHRLEALEAYPTLPRPTALFGSILTLRSSQVSKSA